MKRNLIKRMLTLLLVVCMVVPQTVMAASTYDLTVRIEEESNSQRFAEYTKTMLLAGDKLVPEVVSAINARVDDGELEYQFDAGAMRLVMEDGLKAYAKRSEDGGAAWTAYRTKYDAAVSNVGANDLKSVLINMEATVGDLEPDAVYRVKYTNAGYDTGSGLFQDGKQGTTYVVTITRTAHTLPPSPPSPPGPSGPSTPPVTKYAITVVNDDPNGKIVSDKTVAAQGETVILSVVPNDGYRLKEMQVTDENGNPVPVTKLDSTKCTFVMTGSAVTVRPVFTIRVTQPEETGVDQLLVTDNHIAFMRGDDKGLFRPDDMITRAEVAQMFYNLLKDQNVAKTRTFRDVPANEWYAEAIHTLAALGILDGVGNNRFEPGRSITRAEFATVAARFTNKSGEAFDFLDVDKSHWAYGYIQTATSYGWLKGVGNNRFEPDRPITRTEAAAVVNRMLGRLGDEGAIDAGHARHFPDVNKSHWGWYEICEAVTKHDCSYDEHFTKETWHVGG